MIYFDNQLVTNSRFHEQKWGEVIQEREFYHNAEESLALQMNAASILPRDAWLDLDGITRRVMRNDEGQAFMSDLMPLAKTVNIGKLVHLNRVSSDAGSVTTSMSGQKAVPMDKVQYDYRGVPVPIFDSGYGREWREFSTMQSENFDALADDQEAHTAKVRRRMAQYMLNGDPSITIEGYSGYGIKNSPYTNQIDLGAVNLTTATSEELENFVNGTLGTALDDSYIASGVNWYVSPEIMRNMDKPYSSVEGFKMGSVREWLEGNRRINKIVSTFELRGNEAFYFVPNAEYIRPLIAMPASTIAIPRTRPRDNHQFMISAAAAVEIRADFNGRTGVGYMSGGTEGTDYGGVEQL